MCKPARAVRLETAEYRDTFPAVAFITQIGDIQNPRPIIDCKVYPLENRFFIEKHPEQFNPASFLSIQIGFKLAAALAFKLKQHTFFLHR